MGEFNGCNYLQFNYHAGKANTRELLHNHDVIAPK
jgi:hypothetical protein